MEEKHSGAFQYTYSAAEQEEVKRIRSKYLPKEENKLDRLRRLDASGKSTVLRCPIIPGCNDREEHLAGIAGLAESLQHVQRIDVEPYHSLGKEKCIAIGQPCLMDDPGMPEASTVAEWIAAIQAKTTVPVQKA